MSEIIGLIFILFVGVISRPQEWHCKAVPPEGTKFKNDVEIISINEDKEVAIKESIWLCNKFFKTKECVIEYCKQM